MLPRSAGANRSQLYVQATRGRHANHVIVAGAGDHSQALAVLRTALDQLPDDVTGIEHSQTHPVQAAPARQRPAPKTPSNDLQTGQRRPRRDSSLEALLTRAFNELHHIKDDDIEEAYTAVVRPDGRLLHGDLWHELVRRNELNQPPPQPEPPPLEPPPLEPPPLEPPPLEPPPLEPPPPPKPPPLPPPDIGF